MLDAGRLVMVRAFIGGAIAALIAIIAFIVFLGQTRDLMESKDTQIGSLTAQMRNLETENARLRAALEKVEAEQQRLAAENQEMRRAIATFKATGKFPATPIPPK
jgi:peptidoglycan hydrolase CwlO-like protein